MNVSTFINDAWRMSGVVGGTATPSAEQGVKAITRLNELMAELAEDGVDVGYTPKSSTSDTLVLPDGHMLALKSMLAIRLAQESRVDPPPLIVAQATNGRNRMLGQAVSLQIQRAQSNTLPVGESQRSGYDILTG